MVPVRPRALRSPTRCTRTAARAAAWLPLDQSGALVHQYTPSRGPGPIDENRREPFYLWLYMHYGQYLLLLAGTADMLLNHLARCKPAYMHIHWGLWHTQPRAHTSSAPLFACDLWLKDMR